MIIVEGAANIGVTQVCSDLLEYVSSDKCALSNVEYDVPEINPETFNYWSDYGDFLNEPDRIYNRLHYTHAVMQNKDLTRLNHNNIPVLDSAIRAMGGIIVTCYTDNPQWFAGKVPSNELHTINNALEANAIFKFGFASKSDVAVAINSDDDQLLTDETLKNIVDIWCDRRVFAYSLMQGLK